MDEIDCELPNAGTTRTERQGVAIVEDVTLGEPAHGGLGWMFRPTANSDFGIDGQIEAMFKDGKGKDRPTGKLLSIQVKAGPTYFEEDDGDSWRIYIRKATMNYWLQHSVPVILILVDLKTKQCYWVRGDNGEHFATDKYYRIQVPKDNLYDNTSIEELWDIAQNQTEVDSRFADLENSYNWIKALAEGASIIVSVKDWINKTSERKDFRIGFNLSTWQINHPQYAKVPDIHFNEEHFSYLGYSNIVDALNEIFPWSKVEQQIDEDDLYDRYVEDEGFWDSEEKKYILFSDVSYDDWLEKQRDTDGLVQPELLAGEVHEYVFTLTLGELGKSYLVVRDYLYSTTTT